MPLIQAINDQIPLPNHNRRDGKYRQKSQAGQRDPDDRDYVFHCVTHCTNSSAGDRRMVGPFAPLGSCIRKGCGANL